MSILSEYQKKIKVLDLTRLLPGPYCTMLLGDLGMDVIKIEDTEHGDATRKSASLFNILNRNKKSVALDLKHPKGRELFLTLSQKADVIVEGFRPGVMNRLGLGYKDIKAVNPRIIYCSLSGFGQTGPYKDRPGHDLNYLAMAGMVGIPSQMEFPTGRPATRVSDFAGGLMAALSILSALHELQSSKVGRYIDVAMTDVMASWVGMFLPYLVKDGAVLSKEEFHLVMPGNDMYETKDKQWLTLGMNEDKFWRNLIESLQEEFPSIAIDQWKNPIIRMKKKVELHFLLKGIFLSKPLHYWESLLTVNDIPWAPVQNANDVFNNRHFRERGIIGEMVNPETGDLEYQVGFPALFSTRLDVYRNTAPQLGQHTEEILGNLGYQKEFIHDLVAKNITKIKS